MPVIQGSYIDITDKGFQPGFHSGIEENVVTSDKIAIILQFNYWPVIKVRVDLNFPHEIIKIDSEWHPSSVIACINLFILVENGC